MGYKVLYRKYRPTNFNELVGQKPIKDALINAIIKNQLSHAYIFTGPRGTGKTSMAKIFAKALTCLNQKDGICCNECSNCLAFNENPDIIEIDAASNNGVDEIREIRNNVKLVPTMSKYKIYIIDEVHMLSNSAWNAFLKTLEEPPNHVIFIFATTEINKVPITVLSRCQRYDFHKINHIDIESHIKKISIKEGFNVEDAAIREIIKLSDGCLRDALSYLDQLSKVSNNIDLHLVAEVFGITSLNYIKELLTLIRDNKIELFLEKIDNIIFQGIDCNSLINNIIDFLVDEAIRIKKRESLEFTFEFCYKLMNDLLNIQKGIKFVDNPFKALQMILLNYVNETTTSSNNEQLKKNVKDKNISREIFLEEQKSDVSEKIISREIKVNKNLDQLKSIRINNVFVGANKELKTNFLDKWKEFVEKITDSYNYALLGYVNSVSVEVVSDNYVLFSTKVSSDSIVFNNNLILIEDEFLKNMNIEYKFIALDFDEWSKEKVNFIKNKNVKRKILSEDVLKTTDEKESSVEEAHDIFGDIVEIK